MPTTESRKASGPPDLTKYALAQVRADEVSRACARSCGGCPGPGVEDGCETRSGWPKTLAGEAEWPMCPLGMLRAPAWREIVDTYVAAKVSPIDGWTNGFVAFAHDGVVELHSAVRREDERRTREAMSSKGGSSAPTFSGRRVARGGA